MNEKENLQKIELEVEKAFDAIFQQAKKIELKEEDVEIYPLLEPISEEEDLKKDWEELIGILTLNWEIVPEISEKVIEKCQEMKKKSLDDTNQELIALLEDYLNKVKILDKLGPEETSCLRQLGKIIYDYNFEGKDVKKNLEELKNNIKKDTAEQIKKDTIEQRNKDVEKKEVWEQKIDFLVSQLLKDYQRLVAIEEFLKRNKRHAINKLIIKGKDEIENILLGLDKTYKIRLTEKEKEIREFIRKKDKEEKTEKIEIKVKEGLLCKTMNKNILIPIDEVAFASDIKDWWRPYLHQGEFPLKLLKGKGLFNQIFGKIKSKIQGELKQKEERELRKIIIKTNKLLATEKKLVILWKNEKGLVFLTEDYKLINIDTNITWEPQKEPFIGKALIEGEEVFLFSITKWKNK